jgi:hypothetical protein
VEPQLIRPSLPVTVPEPVPALATVNLNEGMAKFAVTNFASFMVTVQVSVPEQAPDQPLKMYPLLGTAVKVTDVSES